MKLHLPTQPRNLSRCLQKKLSSTPKQTKTLSVPNIRVPTVPKCSAKQSVNLTSRPPYLHTHTTVNCLAMLVLRTCLKGSLNLKNSQKQSRIFQRHMSPFTKKNWYAFVSIWTKSFSTSKRRRPHLHLQLHRHHLAIAFLS